MNLSDQPTFTPKVKKNEEEHHGRPSYTEWDKNDSYLSQDAGVARSSEGDMPLGGIKEKEGGWDFYHGCSSLADTSSSRGCKVSENVPSSSSRKRRSIDSSSMVGTKCRKKAAISNKRGAGNEWSGSSSDEEEEGEENDDGQEEKLAGDQDGAVLDLEIDRDENKGESLSIAQLQN